MDAKTRDILLDRLAAEDLIRMDGKTITATSFEDFFAALHSRTDPPDADSFCGLFEEEQQPPTEQVFGEGLGI